MSYAVAASAARPPRRPGSSTDHSKRCSRCPDFGNLRCASASRPLARARATMRRLLRRDRVRSASASTCRAGRAGRSAAGRFLLGRERRLSPRSRNTVVNAAAARRRRAPRRSTRNTRRAPVPASVAPGVSRCRPASARRSVNTPSSFSERRDVRTTQPTRSAPGPS